MAKSKTVRDFILGIAIGLGVGAAGLSLGSNDGGEETVPETNELMGLWEVTSIRNLTKGEDQPPQREFHLFDRTHQMVVLAGEGRPKLDKSFSDMTPEEILSQQPVGASFYRYEAVEGRITRTNIVALSAYYEGRSFPGEYEVSGDTLVFRDSHSADGNKREWTMRRVE